MQNPRISIIVPCYNGEEYLRETLDCLKNQTVNDWECIIVNDGSTDSSIEIMKEYSSRDSRYKYIDKKNGGPAECRNIAIAASEGQYILPLDSDDLIAPTFAEKAIDYLETHTKCKIVYCGCQLFGSQERQLPFTEYNSKDMPYCNYITNTCVYRKADFTKTSGYNSNLSRNEDWDFLLTFLEKNDEVYCIPEYLYFYRQHGNTRNHSSEEEIIATSIQMIINHPDIYMKDRIRTARWVNPNAFYYKEELYKILNSKSYNVYLKIIMPIRK